MKWDPTDQFGNLFIGESVSGDLDTLRDEIADLVERLEERAGASFTITIDPPYGEINGPDPEQVAYVLRVPWLPGADAAEVMGMVREVVLTRGLADVAVRLA